MYLHVDDGLFFTASNPHVNHAPENTETKEGYICDEMMVKCAEGLEDVGFIVKESSRVRSGGILKVVGYELECGTTVGRPDNGWY